MTDFIYGLLTACFLIAGVFFLRFWYRTREKLLLIFAFAFWLMAMTQALLGILDLDREEQSWVYLLRLSAFVLIIVGIISVNTRRKS